METYFKVSVVGILTTCISLVYIIMLCCYYVGNEFMENIEDPLAPAKICVLICHSCGLLSLGLWGANPSYRQSGNLG